VRPFGDPGRRREASNVDSSSGGSLMPECVRTILITIDRRC
jgi:hypothetical protein